MAMRDERLQDMLRRLADFTTEPVRANLDEDIRHQIPHRLVRHRVNWHTVSIIIDLRLSRSVAAAVVIITMFLWVNFLGGWHTSADKMLQDSKLLIRYGLAGENVGREETISSLEDFHKILANQGRPVPDGGYRVIFNDLSCRTVTPDTLILLQARMVEKKMEP